MTDIARTIAAFEPGRSRTDRGASFDYCYNHFQQRRRNPSSWNVPDAVEVSCMHLGFYLASWGMYRGSASLLQTSAAHLVPTIELIAAADQELWELDVPAYDAGTIESLLAFGELVRQALQVGGRAKQSDILVTKVLLGVFGNVPAFDRFYIDCVRRHPNRQHGAGSFRKTGLLYAHKFYEDNRDELCALSLATLTFDSAHEPRAYPMAKLVDMYFWQKGYELSLDQ
jgi:hypothetical protein